MACGWSPVDWYSLWSLNFFCSMNFLFFARKVTSEIHSKKVHLLVRNSCFGNSYRSCVLNSKIARRIPSSPEHSIEAIHIYKC